jgi:hypothetical protein
MTPDQFRELCRGAARLLELGDPDALFLDADVRVAGVKVGVFHEDVYDSGGVYCYADLGAIEPNANATHLMEEVLALNLELDAALGEVIGIERQSRHLVLRARLADSGEGAHAGQIVDQLRNYAALANELYEHVLADLIRPKGQAA